jgi:hypothetical protein
MLDRKLEKNFESSSKKNVVENSTSGEMQIEVINF